ncbi:hypothetical protein VTL71DRAFT_11808 [Oculimacula yallundae]|uniref:Uncharacterized protein n=1 Tax=Oculimacula yallundae TaxID=86028 RepID=A0ABR4CR84_9HELO
MPPTQTRPQPATQSYSPTSYSTARRSYQSSRRGPEERGQPDDRHWFVLSHAHRNERLLNNPCSGASAQGQAGTDTELEITAYSPAFRKRPSGRGQYNKETRQKARRPLLISIDVLEVLQRPLAHTKTPPELSELHLRSCDNYIFPGRTERRFHYLSPARETNVEQNQHFETPLLTTFFDHNEAAHNRPTKKSLSLLLDIRRVNSSHTTIKRSQQIRFLPSL